MPDWVYYVCSVALWIVVDRVFRHIREIKQYPFRWRCPYCIFVMRSSHEDALLKVKHDHLETFHKEKL